MPDFRHQNFRSHLVFPQSEVARPIRTIDLDGPLRVGVAFVLNLLGTFRRRFFPAHAPHRRDRCAPTGERAQVDRRGGGDSTQRPAIETFATTREFWGCDCTVKRIVT